MECVLIRDRKILLSDTGVVVTVVWGKPNGAFFFLLFPSSSLLRCENDEYLGDSRQSPKIVFRGPLLWQAQRGLMVTSRLGCAFSTRGCFLLFISVDEIASLSVARPCHEALSTQPAKYFPTTRQHLRPWRTLSLKCTNGAPHSNSVRRHTCV